VEAVGGREHERLRQHCHKAEHDALRGEVEEFAHARQIGST
jgi:hypothetical protein